MPAIQQFTRNTSNQLLQGRRANASDLGALQGQAMTGLGNAAKDFQNRLQEIQGRRDEISYHKTLTDFRIETMQRAEEINRTASGDLFEAHSKDFDERIGQLEIPDSMKDRFAVDADNLRLSVAQRAIQERTRRAGVEARENMENILTQNENLVALNPEMQEQALETIKQSVQSLNVDPTTRKAILNKSLDRVRGSAAESLARQSPDLFIEQAKSGNWNDVDNIDKYVRLAEGVIETQTNDANKQLKQQQDLIKSQIDLDLAIAETPDDLAAIAKNISESNLSDLQKNQKLEKVVLKNKKYQEEIGLVNKGFDFASGDDVLNPADKDDKKAFNAYYNKSLEPALQSMPPEQRIPILIDKINNAKVIPDRVKGEMTIAARSKDAEQVQVAVDFFDQLRRSNPMMINDFKNEDVGRVDVINDFITTGYTPKEAIERANDLMSPDKKASRETRKEQLKDMKIDYREDALDVFNSFFSGVVDEDDQTSSVTLNNVSADYKRAYESQYFITGNEEAAKKHAENVIRGSYATSRVNGFKQIMRYAPDAYYTIQGDTSSWIRKDMLEDAQEGLRDIMTQDPIDLNNDIRLVTDHITARTAKEGEPLYQLMYVSKRDGVLRPVFPPTEEGKQRYWKPDVKKRKQELLSKAQEPLSDLEKINFMAVSP
jgi:hypothetical protein